MSIFSRRSHKGTRKPSPLMQKVEAIDEKLTMLLARPSPGSAGPPQQQQQPVEQSPVMQQHDTQGFAPFAEYADEMEGDARNG